jgi:hypothetical protein
MKSREGFTNRISTTQTGSRKLTLPKPNCHRTISRLLVEVPPLDVKMFLFRRNRMELFAGARNNKEMAALENVLSICPEVEFSENSQSSSLSFVFVSLPVTCF